MEADPETTLHEAGWAAAKRWLMKDLNNGTDPYPDFCAYLTDKLQGQEQAFGGWIQGLHNELETIEGKRRQAEHEPPLPPWTPQFQTPPRPANGELSRHELMVFQLSFRETACPRGPPGCADVLEIMDRNFLSAEGNQTNKYPLEVLFQEYTPTGTPPGKLMQFWQVGISIGFGTTLASILGNWVTFKHQEWLPGVKGQPPFQRLKEELCPWLLKMIRLHGICDPPTDTWGLVRKSLGGKIAAASRQRPNPAQMFAALGLQVAEWQNVCNSRKSATALWESTFGDYNKHVCVKACKLQPDEIQAIRLFYRSCEELRRLIRGIWGTDKLGCTSFPLSLAASKFLDPGSERGVEQKDNPLWFQILEVTEEKKILFVERCNGRFMEKVGRLGWE